MGGHHLLANEGEDILVFGDRRTVAYMSTTPLILADGTFSPVLPGYTQLYILHVVVAKNVSVPHFSARWNLSEWKNGDSIFIFFSKNRDNIKTTQYTKLKHHPHDEKAMLNNIMQGDQMKSIIIKVDVGTDEEESRGGGGSPGAPVDHHPYHFILGGPHPRRGRTHKN